MLKNKITKEDINTFLRESNAIEREYSEPALEDAGKAWRFLINFDELTFSRILEVHRILLLNLNKSIAGKIRRVDVYIGYGKALAPERINEKLTDLLELLPKTEDEIKRWHIEYEAIHPFEDGNGRTGRIFLNWQRLQNDLPLLIIHEGEEQHEYYKWFQ